MKNTLFIVLLILVFSSCRNTDPIVDNLLTTEKSNATEQAINSFREHFNVNGSLNTVQNPIGNIIFDFGFEFNYPNTFSYNNGTQVVVNDLLNLINVAVNTTDSLYIDGISFPFNVTTYKDNAIQIMTIENESEFELLLEDRQVINNDCDCPFDNNPVCFEIQDLNGQNFNIQFPNMCMAKCEGLIIEDIVVCDYTNPAINDFASCFEFVFPFFIIDTEGNRVQINNETEFEIAIYSNYIFDFVYPFEILTDKNGQLETLEVANASVFISFLINCVNTGSCFDNCPTTFEPVCVEFEQNGQYITLPYQNVCYAQCDGFTDFVACNNFDCYDNCPQDGENVCVEVNLPSGELVTFIYPNACIAECDGFTEENFVSCN